MRECVNFGKRATCITGFACWPHRFSGQNLLLDWRRGERWFWDCLVDADPASNPANWQWVAGSGLDAGSGDRIFNPLLQGEKFDPSGAYVRQWLPEIAALPDEWLHRPFQSPPRHVEDVGGRPGAQLSPTDRGPAGQSRGGRWRRSPRGRGRLL